MYHVFIILSRDTRATNSEYVTTLNVMSSFLFFNYLYDCNHGGIGTSKTISR